MRPLPPPRPRRHAVLWGLAALRLAALAILLLAGPVAAAGRVALVIGNGAYRHAAPLPNPGHDAEAVADKLAALGFDVVEATDADLQGMRAALADFAGRAAGADVALVFYAGHGMQVGGENFLLPVDAAIATREDLDRAALRASDLFAAFVAAEPELAVVILDACRDNPFAAVAAGPGLASGSAASTPALRPSGAGLIIAFAAAPGAVAADGRDGNSPYTTALLMWLDRPGLEVGTMFRRVRGTVLDLTGGQQVPWVEEALLRDVYLNPGDPGRGLLTEGEPLEVALLDTLRSLDQPLEQAAAGEFYGRLLGDDAGGEVHLAALGARAPLDDADLVRQGLIWLSIREGDDPAVLERFLQVFPGSPFEDLARARLAGLAARAESPEVALLDVSLGEGAPGEAAIAGPGTEGAPGTGRESPGGPLLDPGASDGPAVPGPDEAEAALGLDAPARAAVQRLLAEGGGYAGALDADFGPGTRGALGAFQEGAGLVPTGFLDRATLRALVARAAPAALRTPLDDAARDAIHRIGALAERGAGAEPRVLRVAAIDRNEPTHALWAEVAAAFEADHPGTRVRVEHRPGNDYGRDLLGMLGSAEPPDVLHTWGGGHLAALAEAGFVRDLTPEMSAGWALEFKPGALRTYTAEGRVWGAPTQLSLVSLWVNRPVLERAGVRPEDLATWDGLLAAVPRLKAAGVAPLAVGGRDVWPFQFFWGSLAERAGGEAAFGAALAGEGEGFAAAPFVEAGRRLRDLAALEPFQPGYLQADDAAASDALARGEAAMALLGNWRLERMQWAWPGGPERMREELVRLDFPTLPGAAEAEGTYGGADGFAVRAGAPDEAVDLLRALAGRATQERVSDVASVVPSASGADLALDDPLLADVAAELLGSPHHQLFMDQALGPEAGEALNEAAMGVATGRLTGEAAAAAIDAAWDQELAERGG